jgi:hypothetical protein
MRPTKRAAVEGGTAFLWPEDCSAAERGSPLGKDPSLLARIFHELLSRDHADGCATWQPQGFGSEAYLNGTSQGPKAEDARKDGLIRGCSK